MVKLMDVLENNLGNVVTENRIIGVYYMTIFKTPDGKNYFKFDNDFSIIGEVGWLAKTIKKKTLIPNILPELVGWGGDDPHQAYASLQGDLESTPNRIWFCAVYDTGDKYNTPEYAEFFKNHKDIYKTLEDVIEMKSRFLTNLNQELEEMEETIATQTKYIAMLEGN